MENSKIKIYLISILVALAGIASFGLLWFWSAGSGSQVGVGWYLFSFATGLTMIVLPCTLPLAFVIVPLSMGKGAAKGLSIALAFGLGVTLMLSMYGVIGAWVGKTAINGLAAPLETVKNWCYFIAGIFAFVFALGELGLVRFRMPTYTGSAPAFIQKQGDVLKAFLLGLFLGNIGVGCPHPATPVILTRIATSGDIFYGWLLFLAHAVGRVLPLLMLAILAILGVNGLNWLVKRKEKIETATGWGMVFVAGYILVLGLFTHDWWVLSGQHTLFESLTNEHSFLSAVAQKIGSGGAHAHEMPNGTGLFGLPLWLGNWALVFLWVLPLWWYFFKKKKAISALVEGEEKHIAQKDLADKKWLFITLTALFLVVFVYTLPQRFLHMSMNHKDNHSTEMAQDFHGHGAVEYQYLETQAVSSGFVAEILVPNKVEVGREVKIKFQLTDKTLKQPVAVSALEIEHEKFMHVIGLREDMNGFLHIHPEIIDDKKGSLEAKYIFQKPGKYKFWLETKKAGVSYVFGQKTFEVLGTGNTSEKKVSFGRSVIAGGFQVQLHTGKTLAIDKQESLHFEIHDAQGNEVSVEKYLGADMHLNIIKDDLSKTIHAHPGGGVHEHSFDSGLIKNAFAVGDHEGGHSDSNSSEHGIPFMVEFSKPGLYKAFAQFVPKGANLPKDQAVVAEFWLEVKESTGFEPFSKWILLPISLLLMWLLSRIIKKYLSV